MDTAGFYYKQSVSRKLVWPYRTVLVSLKLNSAVTTYGYGRFLLQTIGLTKAGMAIPYGTGLAKAE